MVAVTVLCILFNIPRYLDDHVVKRPDGSVTVDRALLGNDNTYRLIYTGLIYYIVIYALPVVILAGMTYRHLVSLFSVRSHFVSLNKLLLILQISSIFVLSRLLLSLLCSLSSTLRSSA